MTIKVAEREDMTYDVYKYAGKYYARKEFEGYRGANGMWVSGSSLRIGNQNGYKTERGAINVCKRDAASGRNVYTLIED